MSNSIFAINNDSWYEKMEMMGISETILSMLRHLTKPVLKSRTTSRTWSAAEINYNKIHNQNKSLVYFKTIRNKSLIHWYFNKYTLCFWSKPRNIAHCFFLLEVASTINCIVSSIYKPAWRGVATLHCTNWQ